MSAPNTIPVAEQLDAMCTCPVLTAFVGAWKDSLPNDAERDRLLNPLVPLLVGTRATRAIEERRSYMALDWLIREFTPAWLEIVPALHGHAKALRDLDAISDMDSATAAGVKVRAASAAARAAAGAAVAAEAPAGVRPAAGARAAASAAAEAAAWDGVAAGARAAAWVAAAAAAGAAAAARTAAWDAARAGVVAGADLAPTTQRLQASAIALVHRMIAEAS